MLASWRFWLCSLLLAAVLIAIAVSVPILRRLDAYDKLNARHIVQPAGDDDWITERFGDWAEGLQRVDRISLDDVSADTLLLVSRFHELRQLEYSETDALTDPSVGLVLTLDDVRPLTNLTQLESLWLEGPWFSDEVLAETLSSRPPLDYVVLEYTGAGAATLHELSRIPTITHLSINCTAFSNEDFQGLAALPMLQTASFWESTVGDACVEWLSHSPGLKQLHLTRTEITDAALWRLGELKNLRYVTVCDCPNITSSGVAHLARSPEITILGLPAELLTPQTVEFLKEMPNLRTVQLDGAITDPAVLEVVVLNWGLTDISEDLDRP